MRILLDTNIVLRLGDAHDARLVAAMKRHGLTELLSFNKHDFTRFGAINIFTPADVLAGQIAGK